MSSDVPQQPKNLPSTASVTGVPKRLVLRQVRKHKPDEYRKWDDHAVPAKTVDGSKKFNCTWRDQHGECTYTGPRNLIKRHIEDRHFQIKYVQVSLTLLLTDQIKTLSLRHMREIVFAEHNADNPR